jgi:hypothetical protein
MTNDPGQAGWGHQPPPEEPAYGQPDYGGRHQQPDPHQEYQQPGYPPQQQYGQQQWDQPQQYDPYGQQPAYGQNPQYGQTQQWDQSPQYGQTQQWDQSPQYGQTQQWDQSPQYGQTQQWDQSPQYGQTQQWDQYGQYPQQDYHEPAYQQPGYSQPEYAQPEYAQPDHAPATQQFAPVGGQQAGDPYGSGRSSYPTQYSPPKKKGKGALIGLGVGALVLVLCGGGGIAGGLYLTGGSESDGNPSTGSKPLSAASADPTPSEGAAPTESDTPDGERLNSRTTDPEPVTVSELRASSYEGVTGTFLRTGSDNETDCAEAVDKNAGQLINGLGCTQSVTVTAVNKDKGCVVTFGVLNMPDSSAAEKVIDGMRDGTVGSFIPRRHGSPHEGQAGDPRTGSWWFLMKTQGHYVTFASGAYVDGKRVENRDPTMVACDTDMLDEVNKRIGKRG